MSGLGKQLAGQMRRGLRPSWERIAARFAKSQAGATPPMRMGLVDSFLAVHVRDRLVSNLSGGQLATLLESTFNAQLAERSWQSGPARDVIVAVSGCILHADGAQVDLHAIGELLGAAPDGQDVQASAMRSLCVLYAGRGPEAAVESRGEEFLPGRTFDGDVKGLVAYLDEAIQCAAGLEAVEPAMRNFIAEYDTLRAAGSVGFKTLVLLGLVVGHRIAGLPREEVFDWYGAYLLRGLGLVDDPPSAFA